MIRHLLKLVWNRKKTNLLIMFEVLCSFLVVFALATTGINLLSLYSLPLGYDYEDVWTIEVERENSRYGDWSPEDAETFRRLVNELKSMPSVAAAASATNAPFSHSSSHLGWKLEGRKIESEIIHASETYADVLGVRLVQGRWFNEEDRVLGWDPVLVDRKLANDLFGDEDPLGRRISEVEEPGDKDRRVVGVMEAFRRGGEFRERGSMLIIPAREYADDGAPLNRLVIRVVPGTGAELEEELIERLQGVARAWTFAVNPLEVSRRDHLRTHLVPLLIMGIVGGFLLLMVVLGLTGVMWQNVTRRTKEMGLRRATGAARSSIHRQIVGEVVITAGFGGALGVLLALQWPLIDGSSYLGFGVVLAAAAVASVFMLGLAGACGLYPGWTATRIHPAEALHYE
jgi:putative ABC transport system permease protein